MSVIRPHASFRELYFYPRCTLEQAIQFQKDMGATPDVSVSKNQIEVSMITGTKEERMLVIKAFNLATTSHVNNAEIVIYNLRFEQNPS